MRSFSLSLWLCFSAVVCLAPLRVEGQEQVPQPTKEHELFKADVGTWDAVMKTWVAGPDADPIATKAVEINRLLGNGLWLISDFKATLDDVPFLGHAQMGYDPAKKQYVGTWVDNMTPSISIMRGKYDAEKKTLTMFSKTKDPQSGKEVRTKGVSRYVNDNKRVFTMFMGAAEGDPNWTKFMEITYERKKAAAVR